jgi:hypothetical protein
MKSEAASATSIGARSITSSLTLSRGGNHAAFGSGEEGRSNSIRRMTTRPPRRTRGGISRIRSDEENDANNEDRTSPASASAHRAVAMSPEAFHAISNELLDRIESAVTKLKVCNRGLEITRHPAGAYHGGGNDDGDGGGTMIRHGGRLSIRVLPVGDLYWGGGTYFLTIIPGALDDGVGNARGGGVVTLQSPLSGSFMYVYNPSTKEWVGNEDGHSLLGMLTRDWIRQCNGVPDL